MSVKNPAWRYLPQDGDRKRDERSLMFDRANATESVVRILNDELDAGVPESGEGKSWKLSCPWGIEHSDAGLDKAARYYWESDHAYCFAGHDVLDVVTIRSLMWHCSRYAAARRLLTLHAPDAVPKAQRLAELAHKVRAGEQPLAMSLPQAHQALTASLTRVDGYTEAQYRPAVREALMTCLSALNPSWAMADVLKWIEASTAYVGQTLKTKEDDAERNFPYAKQGRTVVS